MPLFHRLRSPCRSLLAGDRVGARAPRGLEPARSAGSIMKTRLFLALLALSPLDAAPVPHPERPDRLVETREGLSVEYSPGQEAWMEMAFAQMKTAAANPVATPPTARLSGPAAPGSSRYIAENRDVILAAIARQIGLNRPTELQGRTLDTFLGYYKIASEMRYAVVQELPLTLPARHMAIWQRDDLVARMRAGAKIEGMDYDPATDSGHFSFNINFNEAVLGNRLRELNAEIEAQKLDHEFDRSEGSLSASVKLGTAPEAPKAPAEKAHAQPSDLDAVLSKLVFPVIYPGEPTTAPTLEAFAYISPYLATARNALAQQAADYRNAGMVCMILHETAEIGLMENIIASRDRRWLCDGTANYVAWRVARDLFGDEFARQVYDLDAQLRLHAAQQPKINLAAWRAAERQKTDQAGTDLNRAHYAFATRAMFLLTEHHGENALAQLWTDVARTSKKKVTAKTFATAYRKRFKGSLDQLITEAQTKPIPPAIAASLPKS